MGAVLDRVRDRAAGRGRECRRRPVEADVHHPLVDAGIGCRGRRAVRRGRLGRCRADRPGGRRFVGAGLLFASRARERRSGRRRRSADDGRRNAVGRHGRDRPRGARRRGRLGSRRAAEPAHWRWSPPPLDSSGPTPPTPRPPAPPMRPPPSRTSAGAVRLARRRASEIDWSRGAAVDLPARHDRRASSTSSGGAASTTHSSGSIDLMIAVELVDAGTRRHLVALAARPVQAAHRTADDADVGLHPDHRGQRACTRAFPMLALARAVELIIIGTVVQLVSSQGTLGTISRLLHGWVALISLSIVAGLAYVAPTTGPQEGRFTWLSVHSVSAGSMLAVSVPVLFGLWLAAGRRPTAVAPLGLRRACWRRSSCSCCSPAPAGRSAARSLPSR